jgi:hypothetical protein
VNSQLPLHNRVQQSQQENLARFRWHTGVEPTRVHEGDSLPVLFRDVGPEAVATFLRGGLQRLAGPVTPVTYLRTADYLEPYTDYARIGRLALLRPKEVHPWHSGVEHIFISAASHMPAINSLGFIPGTLTLSQAAAALAGARTREELREALGGAAYDELQSDSLGQLDDLNRECRESERWGAPCRRIFQKGTRDARQRLSEKLEAFGLGESDLCAAWHHLPIERRNLLKDVLPRICVTDIIGKAGTYV